MRKVPSISGYDKTHDRMQHALY